MKIWIISIILYVIISYVLAFIYVYKQIKKEPEKWIMYKQNKFELLPYATILGYAPVMLPLTIIVYIKNEIKEWWQMRK